MSFIYLATPYSHAEEAMRNSRFMLAQQMAACVFLHQIPVYSPIVHWHTIAVSQELPHSWDYWKQQDEAMLKACDELWVVMMDGWNTSKGIQAEVNFCRRECKRINYIDPHDLANWCRRYNEGLGRV